MSYMRTAGRKLLLIFGTEKSNVPPPPPPVYAYIVDREGNYGRDRDEAFGVVKI